MYIHRYIYYIHSHLETLSARSASDDEQVTKSHSRVLLTRMKVETIAQLLMNKVSYFKQMAHQHSWSTV